MKKLFRYPTLLCLFIIFFLVCCSPYESTPTTKQTSTPINILITPTKESEAIHISQIPVLELDKLPGSPIFLTYYLGPGLDIIDINNNEVERIFPENYFIDWIGNGCEIVIKTKDSDLFKANITGEIDEELFSYQNLNAIEKNLFGYTLNPSPDHKWVWYWTGKSDPEDQLQEYYIPMNPNIGILALDDQKNPRLLSKNSGAWAVSWAPDTASIAFSDYDENHIQQVYIHKLNENSTFKVTEYLNPDYKITNIAWSPNRKNIAVTLNIKDSYEISILDLK